MNRKRLDNIIFEKAEEAGLTKIICKYDSWFIVSKNIRMVDIEFITRDGKILNCNEDKPSDTDIYVSCGLSGSYSNKSHPCYSMISELLFNL